MTAERSGGKRSPREALRLELEIDQQAPLEGLVSSRTGITRSFAGWAGLASTLTAFLDDWDGATDGDADRAD